MRLKCLTCEVLAREVYWCAAQSPHVVDIELLKQGLHETPKDLRVKLQEKIDSTVVQEYDAIVLGYGLCGKSTEGLAARHVPLVLPRAHDCITLFLGSRERYQQEFEKHSGTYWFANDYVERDEQAGSASMMGAVGLNTDLKSLYDEYVAKFGKDNADYLIEVMGAWQKHYDRAVFVDMGVGDSSAAEAKARSQAAQRGWLFECITGDLILLRRLLNGDWQNDFLVLQPDERSSASNDEQVVCAVRDG